MTECWSNDCPCGASFETEADFAKHFIVPDERLLNLGWCPVQDRTPLRTAARYAPTAIAVSLP
jgi:hypothetical protein